MGMFNSISADLTCPVTGKLSKHTEIQIKWQDRNALSLQVYRLGDILDQLDSRYNNVWVRTDYICDACSPKTVGYKGIKFIRSDDQRRHHVYVQIKQNKICKILTEVDFSAQENMSYTEDW